MAGELCPLEAYHPIFRDRRLWKGVLDPMVGEACHPIVEEVHNPSLGPNHLVHIGQNHLCWPFLQKQDVGYECLLVWVLWLKLRLLRWSSERSIFLQGSRGKIASTYLESLRQSWFCGFVSGWGSCSYFGRGTLQGGGHHPLGYDPVCNRSLG